MSNIQEKTRFFPDNSKLYNFIADQGKLSIRAGDNVEVMNIRDRFAGRIWFLFPNNSVSQSGSNGHVTVDYVAWLWNNLIRAAEYTAEWEPLMFPEKDENWEKIEYFSLQQGIKSKRFPFVCRICEDNCGATWQGCTQSIFVTWVMNDGTVIWFLQNWLWWEWWFCDVEKVVNKYFGGKTVCREV